MLLIYAAYVFVIIDLIKISKIYKMRCMAKNRECEIKLNGQYHYGVTVTQTIATLSNLMEINYHSLQHLSISIITINVKHLAVNLIWQFNDLN